MSARPLAALVIAVVLALIAVLGWTAYRRLSPQLELYPVDPSATTAGNRGRGLEGRRLPALAPAAWLGGRAMPAESLAGRPVLIALWSATQPASLRGAPLAEAWHQAYARYGLRVVGVHLPEFAFATDTAVAARAARRLGLAFPIAHDATLTLWSAFGPHETGPRFVLADPGGSVVLDTTGVESAPVVEEAIRGQLLALRPDLRFPRDGLAGSAAARGASAPAIVHLGTARVAAGPIATAAPGRPQHFTAQFRFQVEGRPYVPYPVGYWTPNAEGLIAQRGGAAEFVALRYDAPSLGVVMSPPASGPVRVWVLNDERWLEALGRGADVQVDARGGSYVLVDEPRLYSIWNGARSEHVVKLSPESRGVTIHAFTFERSTPAEPARP